MNELHVSYPSGSVVYDLIRRRDDLFMWRHAALVFEAYNVANWVHYKVPLTDRGGDLHSADFPPSIAAGWYLLEDRVQAGGSPASSDVRINHATVYWNGSAVAEPPEPAVAESYLTAGEGADLADTIFGLAFFKAAGASEQLVALVLASDRFDTAHRYQGRKYATDGTQPLEFPRLAYGSGAPIGSPYASTPAPPLYPPSVAVGATVWDWDFEAGEAIVPGRVKRAVLFEADSLIKGDRDRQREAAAAGLASQTVGPLSETYFPALAGASDPNTGAAVLCPEADRIARLYRLRSGNLL